jgi:hypothetical protein
MCKIEQTAYRVRCIAGVEVSMLREESNSDTVTPSASNLANDFDTTAIPPEVLERSGAVAGRPESGTIEQSSRKSDALVVRERVALNELFVTRKWHRSYAEALLETDGAKLPALIAAAGEAILVRYVELTASPVPTDEIVDLQHAVVALSQLSEHTGAGGIGLPDIC